MIEQTTFSSTMLASGEYDTDTGDLEIEFARDGSTYSYPGVPATVWKALQAAASPGRYFAQNIKDVYG